MCPNNESRRAVTGAGQATVGETARARSGGQSLMSLVINWTGKKYIELKHFKMEVTNIFLVRHYDISEAENVPLIKKSREKEA